MSNPIQDKAILMKIHIGLPGLSRKDAETTREVIKYKGMGKDAGQWKKQLYPDSVCRKPEGLKRNAPPMNAWVWQSQFTDKVEKVTVAWPDVGYKLVPLATYTDFTTLIQEERAVFKEMEEVFVKALPESERWAKGQHNGTFDPKFYVESWVRARFKFKVDPRPIPKDDHFSKGIVDIVGQTNVEQAVSDALDEANKDLFGRLVDPLTRAIETLSDGKKVFRDTLISNIERITNEVSKLNVMGNTDLVKVCERLKNGLLRTSPERLRRNSHARKQAVDETKSIMDQMKGYITI